jgi:hypothetical protein
MRRSHGRLVMAFAKEGADILVVSVVCGLGDNEVRSQMQGA